MAVYQRQCFLLIGFIGALSLLGCRDVAPIPPTWTVEQSLLGTEIALVSPVTRNDQWTPIEQVFDDVVMVLVPSGCFMMGSTAQADEQPIHEYCFDAPFWIDKYEVTQIQFRQLGGIKNRPNEFLGDNLPVEMVDWADAIAFCYRRGGRLPTEAEWEYASRGVDNRIYPWGDEFISENLVYASNSQRQTNVVGTRPDGASWVGALDMAGNVWEWVSSLYAPYPYDTDNEDFNPISIERVIRGGAWNFNETVVRSANRNWSNTYFVSNYVGFRCARDYP